MSRRASRELQARAASGSGPACVVRTSKVTGTGADADIPAAGSRAAARDDRQLAERREARGAKRKRFKQPDTGAECNRVSNCN